MSGTTKSHRGTKDRDMIQFGHDEAHLEMVVEKKGLTFQIDMHLKKNSPKGIAIDRIPIRKASELFGIVHFCIFFAGRSEHHQRGTGGKTKIYRS